jgi:hypothetical protein
MITFFQRFRWKYSSSITITISLENYESIKISQFAPDFHSARDILISNLKTIGLKDSETKSKVDNMLYRLFGRDYDSFK